MRESVLVQQLPPKGKTLRLDLAAKIRRARTARLMTSGELAELAGVPAAHVEAIETGQGLEVPLASWAAISKALGMGAGQ